MNNCVEHLPAELATVRAAYESRLQRARDAVEPRNLNLTLTLHPKVAAHRAAVRAFEDYFDELLILFGREPEDVPLTKWNPEQLSNWRNLKRSVEDSETEARKLEAELTRELQDSSEFQALRKVQFEYQSWLQRVCFHYKCSMDEIDWVQRTVRRTAGASAPAELAVMPD